MSGLIDDPAADVEAEHGGRIWVESVPRRETTFHVALPLAAGAAPASVAPPTADIR